ncbi:non-homologous end joining protein Ku [Streptomyces alanosinicus]|uniref:non-homologous end joining protein Ku n=1 Tax=Streptomyces alanosinicus TaxID=68171 RepID=UPI0027E3BFDA|nr:Ku protein [Streptomyces alanosinicus]
MERAISFGLVTVPVAVQAATESHSITFHQYHLADMSRVRVRKYCGLEDRPVDETEIGKGYEVSKTQVIPITDEELRRLPLPTARAIEIETFVPLESIDPIRIGAGYYLAATEQVAAKPYKLLVEALRRSSRVAVAKWAWHGRERLGLLRVRGDVMVMHLMLWPDEVRSPEELLPPPIEVPEDEIEGALALIDTMTVDDLSELGVRDEYTEAIAQIIEAKREQKPLPEAPEPAAAPGQLVDLMAALNESVQRAKTARGEDAGPAEVHKLPKKAPSKKQPAKKATAKKTTAKKPSGRRPQSA